MAVSKKSGGRGLAGPVALERDHMNGFLWGAATAAHQVEGNNVNSDWWQRERDLPHDFERSGDATDHYHRYPEDMQLLADAGLNAYRFSLEWARIEPDEGHISRAELMHYRRMIDTAISLGLTPVVTLHHTTHPHWFSRDGGWNNPKSLDRFRRYVEAASTILQDVQWVVTINEPNLFAVGVGTEVAYVEWEAKYRGLDHAEIPSFVAPTMPDPSHGELLAKAHRIARQVLKESTQAKVGWSIANLALEAAPGAEETFKRIKHICEDQYLEVSRDDDFVGVQAYTSQLVNADGIVPHPSGPENTILGTAYRPDAIGIALRNTAEVTGGTPILITENGIAIADDRRRIAYTEEALRHVFAAVDDGIDVRGYLHWSALDNYEWGHWAPTFGLIAVDRETFVRTPKPSLAWLGTIARTGRPSID